jgi:MtN3 and saliva related transmembrane protein
LFHGKEASILGATRAQGAGGLVNMDRITILGLAAGTLTTIAFLPQLIKTWKTKSASDVSFGMVATFTTGVFLWLLYGLFIDSLPVILANAVTLLLAGIILILKVKYG